MGGGQAMGLGLRESSGVQMMFAASGALCCDLVRLPTCAPKAELCETKLGHCLGREPPYEEPLQTWPPSTYQKDEVLRRDTGKIIVGVVFSVLFLSLVNLGCFETRKRTMCLYAIKSLGAHLYAFAGIAVFAPIASRHTSVGHCLLVFLAALLSQFVMLAISACCRSHLSKQEGNSEDGLLMTASGHPAWHEAAREAEDEGASLVLSLLANMTICLGLTGEMIPYEPEAHADPAFVAEGIAGSCVLSLMLRLCVQSLSLSLSLRDVGREPKSVELAKRWPTSGRMWPGEGRIWPGFDRILGEFGQLRPTWAKLVRFRHQTGPGSPRNGPSRPNLARNRPVECGFLASSMPGILYSGSPGAGR